MIHTIFRDDEIIVAVNGIPYTVSIDDDRYDDVYEAIMDEDEDALENLLTRRGKAKKLYADLGAHGITQVDGDYFYEGNPIAMDLTDYLAAAIDSGQYMPIVRFIQRLYENPSEDTRKRLFTFMEVNKMPIDSEGRFLAYKAVSDSYYDKHSGTVYNGPGTTVPVMKWSQIDTNPDNTCSRGYHACSRSYLDTFFYSDGDRVVTVAISPEDVGAIPADYNGAKLRCRTYTVVADITEQYKDQTSRLSVGSTGLDPNREAYSRRRGGSDYY